MKRKSHGDFVSELKQSKPNIIVVGEYINCSTKIEICCSKCNHSWFATPNSLLRGSGCPQCANNQKKSHDRFVVEIREINPYIENIGKILQCTHSDKSKMQNLWK